METALAQAEVSIPFQARDRVWEILERLSRDIDPTPEREAKKNGSNYDFATISINATRGQAMHAIVRYVLWVRKNTSAGSSNGFDDMNEVRSVLDQHLDISKDPSLAIRSVYGGGSGGSIRWTRGGRLQMPLEYFQKRKSCCSIGKQHGHLTYGSATPTTRF